MITFYINSNRAKDINKKLSSIETVMTYFLLDETSVIDPVVTVECRNLPYNYNYAYISEFNRYYFINNIKYERTGVYTFEMHVDVLYTYKDAILSTVALVDRSASEEKPSLPDSHVALSNSETQRTFAFSSVASDPSLILLTCGPGGQNV